MYIKDSTIKVFFLSFFIVFCSGYALWRFFFYQQPSYEPEISEVIPSGTYEAVDLVMPVQAFLARGANSAELSMIRRVFVNQWICANENDFMKLIVYAQGATSFQDLKKILMMAMEKEGEANCASPVVRGAIETIEQDESLIKHVNDSLKEGMTQDLHMLKGRMATAKPGSKEFKKLKAEYRKVLDEWIDKKHGALLDQLISKV